MLSPPVIPQVGRIAGEPSDFGLPGAREKHAGGDLKVVVTTPVSTVRNPTQRVDYVFVESGKETEAMLAGKRKTTNGCGVGNRDAAAEYRFAFVNIDRETALCEFVSCAQSGNSAAEDCYSL